MRHTVAALLLAAAPVAAADKVTYEQHVLPLLKEKCVACHDPDKVRGGLDVSSYAKLMEGGASGAVVKPGDADGSRLFQVVSHKVQPFMPPKSDMIPTKYLDTIKTWISQGAPENAGSKTMAAKPKADIGLASVVRGKPAGPPPMPEPGKLSLEPVVFTSKPNAVVALASNPWAPLVAVGGQKQVVLYNSDTLALVGVLPFPYGLPTVLRFSRNGSLLLAAGGRGGQSGKVVVWNVRTGEKVIEVGDETDAVLAADISPDQTQIALGGPSKIVRVFSTKDGEKIRDIKKHTDWIYALEYSPDGVLLATADRSGGLFVWEAFTGREYFNLRGHTAAVTGVSWRNDSNVLASCSEDTTVRLWEMENGGQIKSWGAHGGGTLGVSFAKNGQLTSAGRDRVAKVWDGNGTQLKQFEPFPDVALRSTFTHDDNRVVAADWTGIVRLWAVADTKPVGNITANPASPADQLTAALVDLTAKQAAYDQSKAATDAATAVAQKANTDLAAAQKVATDAAAVVNTTTAAANTAKAEVDTVTAAMSAAQGKIPAKEASARILAGALQQIQAEAAKVKNDPNFAAEVQKSQQFVSAANAELEAAKKAFADAGAAQKAAQAKMAAAQNAVTQATAAQAAAAKVVEGKAAEAKAANDKLGAAQTAMNQATAALLAAARVVVEKHQAVTPKK